MTKTKKKLPSMSQVLETIRKEDKWDNDFWAYKEEAESNPHKKEDAAG